jgi:hypothetical protein
MISVHKVYLHLYLTTRRYLLRILKHCSQKLTDNPSLKHSIGEQLTTLPNRNILHSQGWKSPHFPNFNTTRRWRWTSFSLWRKHLTLFLAGFPMNCSFPISVAFRVTLTSSEEFLFFRLGIDDAGPAAFRPSSEISCGVYVLIAHCKTDNDFLFHLRLSKLHPLALNKTIRTSA